MLYKIEAIDLRTYRRLSNMSGTIRRMLIASVTTVKSKYLDISDENERNIP